MDVVLANPRGFCAGVDRAIAIVEQALTQFGAPIYVRHEVVHNRFVVDDLKAKGAVFVEELDEVPPGSTVVFSAHGVSRAVRADAEARGLRVFDATCPLVTKVHIEVARMREHGRTIVMIGHAGHPEVEGTMGQCSGGAHLVESVADVERLAVGDNENLAYVTQTTLSVDDAAAIVEALKRRFPHIVGPKKDDICYATQNRQDAVKMMAPQVDVVIVVGSPNSSNSNRLREVAAHRGIPAFMVDRADEVDARWIEGKTRVGVTAGASAPEVLVREVVDRLKSLGATSVRELRRHTGAGRVSHAEGTAFGPCVGRRGMTAASACLSKRAQQRDEGGRAQRRSSAGDERMPPRLGHRAHDRLGKIERQQQRRDLPRPDSCTRNAGPHERERECLQREPRAAGPQRRQHGFPEDQQEHESADQHRGDALPAMSTASSASTDTLRLPAGAV